MYSKLFCWTCSKTTSIRAGYKDHGSPNSTSTEYFLWYQHIITHYTQHYTVESRASNVCNTHYLYLSTRLRLTGMPGRRQLTAPALENLGSGQANESSFSQTARNTHHTYELRAQKRTHTIKKVRVYYYIVLCKRCIKLHVFNCLARAPWVGMQTWEKTLMYPYMATIGAPPYSHRCPETTANLVLWWLQEFA